MWQGRLSVSMSKDRSSLEIRHNKLASAPSVSLKLRGNVPPLYFEEHLHVAATAAGNGVVPRDQDDKGRGPNDRSARVSHYLASLSDRLSKAGIGSASVMTTIPNEVNGAPPNKAAPTTKPTPKHLSCTFVRTPLFLDKQGRRMNPPAHVIPLMPPKEETTISLWVRMAANKGDGKTGDSALQSQKQRQREMRDVELILADSFGRAATSSS